MNNENSVAIPNYIFIHLFIHSLEWTSVDGSYLKVSVGYNILSFLGVSNENGGIEENVSISVVDTLHQKYLNSSLYESTKEALGKVEIKQERKKKVSKKGHEITYANGFFTQLYWVSNRSLKNLIRNPQASVAQVGNNY